MLTIVLMGNRSKTASQQAIKKMVTQKEKWVTIFDFIA